MRSRWFEGACRIQSYELHELLGTRLRALYQQKRRRDLFDLANALQRVEVRAQCVIDVFAEYMAHQGRHVSRTQFEQNLSGKRPLACGHPTCPKLRGAVD